MTLLAKTVVLKHNLDEGVPGPDDFTIESAPAPSAPADGLLIQALVFSADPYLRMGLKTGQKKPGAAMEGFIAGKVLESKHSDWKTGDLFGSSRPFTTVQAITADELKKTLIWKLTDHITEEQISLGIGVLGMPGATSYGGVVDVLQPKEGETVFISAASGAVGSVAGQLAKNVFKCKTIGSCGGPAKTELIQKKFGFDHAIDYKQLKNKDDLVAALKAVAPEGINMYFENVGGMHFDAALASLQPHGRIAVCGSISTYNSATPERMCFEPMPVIYRRLRIEGFVSTDWLTTASFLEPMSKWWKEGKIEVEETVHEGIEQWPTAFQSLFHGGNTGKVVVRVA